MVKRDVAEKAEERTSAAWLDLLIVLKKKKSGEVLVLSSSFCTTRGCEFFLMKLFSFSFSFGFLVFLGGFGPCVSSVLI